jgi:superfamily II DNA or RNA helicase
MYTLRDYQQQGIDQIRSSLAQGKKAPLYVLPTGGGKSAIICTIIEAAVQRGSEVFFIAPRRQLVYQISEDLQNMKVYHSIMMSGKRYTFSQKVMVASLDTLFSRIERVNKTPKLIIIDEAHTVLGQKIKTILERFPDVTVIGFTATPARSDGRGLGEMYDDMITGASMKELIERGFLVPCRYFTTPNKVDLSDVKISMGDYNQKQLDTKMNDPMLIGDIVENWKRVASDRQTVVFAVKRTHAVSIQERFNAAGIPCGYIDGNTSNDDRIKILDQLESGEIRVLSSVDVLSYGWNSPVVSCGIIARPTKSIARYLQMIGRIVRSFPGKEDAIVLDHANVVSELGFVEDEQFWSLDGEGKVQDRKREKKKELTEPAMQECPHCNFIQKPMKTCMRCKKDISVQYGKAIEEFKADLAEMEKKTRKKQERVWTAEEKQMLYSELLQHSYEKAYNIGWCKHKYKERTGVWPSGLKEVPRPVGEETKRWIKSQQIRYAKRKDKGTRP